MIFRCSMSSPRVKDDWLVLMTKLGINVDLRIVELSHPQAGVKFRHPAKADIQVTTSVNVRKYHASNSEPAVGFARSGAGMTTKRRLTSIGILTRERRMT